MVPKSFATIPEREAHENRHSRPFNCPHSTCDYNKIGFTTKQNYNQHLRNYHTTVLDVNVDSLNDIEIAESLTGESSHTSVQSGSVLVRPLTPLTTTTLPLTTTMLPLTTTALPLPPLYRRGTTWTPVTDDATASAAAAAAASGLDSFIEIDQWI